MDGCADHLARINCILNRASVELDEDDYWEFLAQLQYELSDRPEPDEYDRDEDGPDEVGG